MRIRTLAEPIPAGLKQEVIYQDNPARLFEIMVEANEKIAALHLELAGCEDYTRMTIVKGEISIYKTLLTIIDKRIDEVKAADHEKERREMLSNRQFKIAAEAVLKKETFEKIKELSLINYRKFKDIRLDLRMNKIE